MSKFKQLLGVGPHGLWGDACLYLGMFVAANWREAISDFSQCIDGEGRLWRNPDETWSGKSAYGHGTSRDMMAGFLLGCVGNPSLGRKLLPRFVAYVKKHRRLAPSGDARTQLRPGSWVDIGNAVKALGLSVFKSIGFRGWLCWILFRHTKSKENYLSAVTAWKDYQLHLILVSLLTKKAEGRKFNKLDLKTLLVLDERLPQNAIVRHLLGDYKWLAFELPHMYNRAQASKEPYVWPWAYGSFPIAAHHMPMVAVQYMEYLLKRTSPHDQQ